MDKNVVYDYCKWMDKRLQLSVTFQVSCSSCPVAPAAIVTTLPGSRIIRQSSQPEASVAPCCGVSCVHNSGATHPSTSLRQLRDHDSGGIAGIAADSLRINGAMRHFRQVGLMRQIPLSFYLIQVSTNLSGSNQR